MEKYQTIYNDVMTVTQLVNLLFLQSNYELIVYDPRRVTGIYRL